MSHILDTTSIPETSRPLIRPLASNAPYRWLRKGWADFRASMGPSLTLGSLFVLAGYVITFASANTPLLTISSTSVSGSSPSTPVPSWLQ